jgi:hypothetical protein
MKKDKSAVKDLEDVKVNVKIKLSALWAALMLCYVYADIVNFFKPGVIEGVLSGGGISGPPTQMKLLGLSLFMAVPCIMVFLPLVLLPRVCRLVNIILGIIYALAVIVTFFLSPWLYYVFFGIIEIALTVLIVLYSWKWPGALKS